MASLAAPFPTDALRDAGAQMRQPHRSPTMPAASAAGRSSYGGGRPNWAAFGLIGAAHVAAVAVLMTTGVIQTGAAPPPVRVNFVEEIVEPAVPPPAPLEVIEPVPTEVFLPDVIVETTAPPPPPTVTASEIPPAPQTMAAPVVSRSIDAPVVPPDFSADQLNNPGPRYPSASRRS
ncbi:MAG: hypothetical protein Q7J32_10495, partial [Sphingomonadaceae bacterium]|nr:hypothetical protein [Sphingomonadaceae bacterium]